MVELLAARRRPLQQLDGAVDGDAFLVAGDQERDRALRLARRGRRGGRARRRASRRCRPSCRPRRGRTARRPRSRPANGGCVQALSSPGGTTSVWPAKHEMRRPGADARVEIVDVRRARLAEGHAMDVEAGARQDAVEQAERAAFRRGHRRAAQQVAGEGNWIGCHACGFSRLGIARSTTLAHFQPGAIPGSVEPVGIRARAYTVYSPAPKRPPYSGSRQRIGAVALGPACHGGSRVRRSATANSAHGRTRTSMTSAGSLRRAAESEHGDEIHQDRQQEERRSRAARCCDRGHAWRRPRMPDR